MNTEKRRRGRQIAPGSLDRRSLLRLAAIIHV